MIQIFIIVNFYVEMLTQKVFRRFVTWTQICKMNTRYTVYEQNEFYDTSDMLTVIIIPGCFFDFEYLNIFIDRNLTGNPGNDRFYEEFCGNLIQQMIDCGRNLQIFSVSHANHVLIDDDFAKDYKISNGCDYESIKRSFNFIAN